MHDLLKKAWELIEDEESIAFVTITETDGSVPQIPGAKMIVVDQGERHLTYGTVGGGALEHHAVEEALEVIRSGNPSVYKKDLGKDLNMACGGRVSYFVEPLQPRERMIICGGGHIGKALFAIIKNMGFRTVVIDSMEEYANQERFPGVDKIINSFDEKDLEDQVITDDHTYIVIVSRDHPTDFRLARIFLNKPWNYLGVIASKTKSAVLRKELKEEGFPEDKVEALVSPIGKPIGGSSPEEIAVSIAAQLVEKRNKG